MQEDIQLAHPDMTKEEMKDSIGRYRTEALFYEVRQRNSKYSLGVIPRFTMKEDDKPEKNLISARRVFMESTDEYEAAMRIVGSLTHWRKLCSLKWFRDGEPLQYFDGVEQWRKDKRDRDQSEVKSLLLKNARKGDTAAAKKLWDEIKKETAKNAPGTKVKVPEKGKYNKAQKTQGHDQESELENRIVDFYSRISKDD